MTEKQFYDWQPLGGTDDVMRYVKGLGNDLVWNVARNGDEFLLRVFTLENGLNEKIRAWNDPTRRQSQRFKDLADIARLVEAHPELCDLLPDDFNDKVAEL